MSPPASSEGALLLREFKRKLTGEWQRRAACGREYVNVFKLQAWMRSTAPGWTIDNFTRLLFEAWRNWGGHQPPFRPKAESISTGDQCAVLVFSILLELEHGHLIKNFQDEKILDKDLEHAGVDYRYVVETLQKHNIPDAKRLVERFEEKKWSYCPVIIKHRMSNAFRDGRWVIPFCKRQEVNEKGGTAQVWQVLIQEDFVSREVRDIISGSRIEDADLGPCYQLALKTYPSPASDIFDWEIFAFSGIQGKEGMVQYLGHYSLNEDPNDGCSPSHNILLEYGEHDLEEFFASPISYPPVRTPEIIGFWRSLFKVAEALKRIHILDHEQDGQTDEFYGWHADVKPDNILRVHGEFKLADFGFAKFRKRNQGRPMSYIEGGTQTFGAPETDPARSGTRTAHTQTIDTWSFGCVLSVAATWVVLGYQGMLQYAELRKQGVKRAREPPRPGRERSMPTADDAFHDGREILPEVRHWHNYLSSIMRDSDTTTLLVLQAVERTMLLEHPQKRSDSTALCKELNDILVLARHAADKKEHTAMTRGMSTHETVLQALLTVDNKSPANTIQPSQQEMTKSHRGSRLSIVQDRDHRASGRKGKSERIDNIPLAKTAHRAELLQNELNGIQGNPFPDPRDQQTSNFSGHQRAPEAVGIFESPEPTPDLQDSPEIHSDDIDFHLSPPQETESSSPPNPGYQSLEPQEPPWPRSTRDSYVTPNLQDPRTPPRPHPTVVPDVTRNRREPRIRNRDVQSPGYYYEEHPKSGDLKGKQPQQPLSPPLSDPATPGLKENLSQTSRVVRRPPGKAEDFGPPLRENSVVGSQNILVEQTSRSHNRFPSYTAAELTLQKDYDIYKVRERLESEPGRSGFAKFFKSPKADQDLQKFIVNRDMIFIVDNGDTMGPFWKVATYVLETLAMKLAPLDEDGLDLVFTIGHEMPFNAKGKNASKEFRKQMDRAAPSPMRDSSGEKRTNMAETLGRVFTNYTNQTKSKRMTLLVLTDGRWRGTTKGNMVEDKIATFVKNPFVQKYGMEDRRFSISFIQFGDDQDAFERLKWLDDQWSEAYNLPDMIDHVSWTGSVRKMILGSLEEDMDEEDETTFATESTSQSRVSGFGRSR